MPRNRSKTGVYSSGCCNKLHREWASSHDGSLKIIKLIQLQVAVRRCFFAIEGNVNTHKVTQGVCEICVQRIESELSDTGAKSAGSGQGPGTGCSSGHGGNTIYNTHHSHDSNSELPSQPADENVEQHTSSSSDSSRGKGML